MRGTSIRYSKKQLLNIIILLTRSSNCSEASKQLLGLKEFASASSNDINWSMTTQNRGMAVITWGRGEKNPLYN